MIEQFFDPKQLIFHTINNKLRTVTTDIFYVKITKVIKFKEKFMIFKVTYQQTKTEAPRREFTQTLYIEAENSIIARKKIEENTAYNIEFIQELSEKHLAYEQQSPDFKLTEF